MRSEKVGRKVVYSVRAAEQPLREQGLHVAPAIGDQVHDNLGADYPVNQPIGLEKHLTVLVNAKRQQFPGVRAALGKGRQIAGGFQQPVQQAVGTGFGAVMRDVIVERLQIALRARGQQDLVGHGFRLAWCAAV